MGLFGRRSSKAPLATGSAQPPAKTDSEEGAELLKRISVALETPRPSAEDVTRSSEPLAVPPTVGDAPLQAEEPEHSLPTPVSETPAISKEEPSTVEEEPKIQISEPITPGTSQLEASSPDLNPEVPASPPPTSPKPAVRSAKHRISMYLNPFSSRSSAKINASHKELDSLPTDIPIADDEIEEGHQEVLVEPQAPKQKLSKSNKKKKGADAAPVVSPTAVTIQNLLSGDVATTTTSLGKPSSRTKALTTAQTRIAPELLHEDKANKVISEVRQLSPLSPLQERKATPATPQSALAATPSAKQPPAVHAVCLDATDEEVAEKVFTQLTPPVASLGETRVVPLPAHVIATDRQGLENALHSLNIIPFLHVDPAKALSTLTSLVTVSPVSPQILPPNAPVTLPDAGELAMLAGAVPSPQTIVDGVNDVATTLIALGLGDPEALYATSGTPPDLSKWLPDHKGVYPPKDRMSILTYWWGYELVLPEPSMKNLARAKSIEGMVLNFLTFFAMLNGGVREILPFVRYIAQFIDIEWSSMTAKDRGKGVICAATWLLPTSIVTRSWDFPEPPPPPPPPASSPAHDQNQKWHWWNRWLHPESAAVVTAAPTTLPADSGAIYALPSASTSTDSIHSDAYSASISSASSSAYGPPRQTNILGARNITVPPVSSQYQHQQARYHNSNPNPIQIQVQTQTLIDNPPIHSNLLYTTPPSNTQYLHPESAGLRANATMDEVEGLPHVTVTPATLQRNTNPTSVEMQTDYSLLKVDKRAFHQNKRDRERQRAVPVAQA